MTKQDIIQNEIVEKASKFFKTEKFGYLDVSVRVGKCKITIDLLKKDFVPNEVILLCYPDNRILESWTKDIEKWKYNNPNIIFCNFSSLHKYKDKIFGLVVIDEFPSASENEREICHIIMTNDKKTKCLALSGTISKESKEEWGLKEIAKYTTEQAIEDGILSDYQITVHLVDLDTIIKTKNSKGKEITEKQRYDNYTYVIEKMKKNGSNFMHLALSCNRLSLSSIGKVNYTKKLLKQLNDKRVIVFTGLANTADSLGIPSYHSKSESDKAFKDFQEGKSDKLALAAIAKMGVTFFSLESVILLNFTYNAEESKQMLTRSLIMDYKGKIADLHLICLRENPELKKVEESLSMLDKTKIKYV